MKQMMNPALVLTTVNAPHSLQLDAPGLAHCLLDQAAAKAVPGHMSSFFGEVAPALQIDFAQQFDITQAQLVAAAKAFAAYSGESYPLAG
jgi:hypothetical protein